MKGMRIYMAVSILLIVAYLVVQYNRPVPTDWSMSLKKEDKIPFGTFILYGQLGKAFPGVEVQVSRQRIYSLLKGREYSHTTLFIVASIADIDKTDMMELKRFVSSGNCLFIASSGLHNDLAKFLKTERHTDLSMQQEQSRLNFVNPQVRDAKDYVFDREIGIQFYGRFDTARAVVLGQNHLGQSNFIKYPMGKGSVYLLSDPSLLSNYSLLKPRGAEYAAKVLSHLPQSRTLIWDEYNTKGVERDQSILRVIFSYPSLRWAYYLSLGGLLLFVLFEMKRRQRVIPVLEPPVNSSVEFAKVVSDVYYQQHDNRDIALKKVNYFMEQLRNEYNLNTSESNQELEAELLKQSGVEANLIAELFIEINLVRSDAPVSDPSLIRLNQLIEQFHQQSQ